MSGTTIHKQARTTPQLRAKIRHSALQRLLIRHGVSQRKNLIATPEGETPPKKSFKDYVPGYLHIDIKYLPQMCDEHHRTYLFVAIDRASRWVYLERHREKSCKSALRFLNNLREKAPFVVKTLLTDNDLAFTDRLLHPEGPATLRRPCPSTGSAPSTALTTGSPRRVTP